MKNNRLLGVKDKCVWGGICVATALNIDYGDSCRTLYIWSNDTQYTGCISAYFLVLILSFSYTKCKTFGELDKE